MWKGTLLFFFFIGGILISSHLSPERTYVTTSHGHIGHSFEKRELEFMGYTLAKNPYFTVKDCGNGKMFDVKANGKVLTPLKIGDHVSAWFCNVEQVYIINDELFGF